jgi:predicted secreted protein
VAASTFNVTATKTGTGVGTVTSSPAGINCGSTCTFAFDENLQITLSASPATNSNFTGWSGEGCSGTGTCVVTASQARSVTATFTQKPTPVVTITRKPPATVKGKAGKTATFQWISSVPGSTFTCRRDKKGSFTACTSPKKYTGIRPGIHYFEVRATANGMASAIVQYKWTVRK